MNIIRITDGDRSWVALKVPALTGSSEDIAAIVAVLTGQHELSAELLNDVIPGSSGDTLGAQKFMIVAFDEAPAGGFGVGGVYGVMNWVRDHLDPAMPDGLGAAHSEPVMWPLVGNSDRTEYRVERDGFVWRDAEINELPVAHCALISPMDRSTTRTVGAFLRDFDAPDGTPELLPTTV